ncbi:MAG: M3 family oligoendopeptidase [Kiloniellales bacterium]
MTATPSSNASAAALAPPEAAPRREAAARPALGRLPSWDLSHLYPAPESPELDRDLRRAEADAKAFQDAYKGRLKSLDGAALGAAVAEYERLDEAVSRVMSYAQLKFSGDMSDPETGRFYQTTQERVNDVSAHLLFFTLELNRLDDAVIEPRLEAPALRYYAPWIRDTRVFRPHQLDDDLERLLHDKHVVGRAAWIRLFDETLAGLRFLVDGRRLTCTEVLHLLTDKDGATRHRAATALGQVLGENQRQFALVINTLMKDKAIEDKWRGFARPVAARNLSNLVEDEVVDALATAVKAAYGELSHRYYRLKARWFDRDVLDHWDRNAPLPEDDDRLVPWNEARDTVLQAYAAFSPEMAAVGRRFFDEGWIDAPVRPGKASGAFSHPTVPGAHPYILLNYQGRTRDVMTLAHELGHGVHQVLAGAQGQLMASTPLTLAETASVFGEMLTFRRMLDGEAEPRRRRVMLATKVEDMLNTVVRQIALYDFECRLHDERRDGELTADRIGRIWLDVQGESLGPAIRFDEGYRHFWAYIPHFVHSPFYVYAYAFGDCLVNSLYAVYQDARAGFVDKYLDMLGAGGTRRHRELLAPFGLDASDPGFWSRGLEVIGGFIDQLEADA